MTEVGLYNSSITRVRPFFQQLLRRDATGVSWLPRLLGLVAAPEPIIRSAGRPLLPQCATIRSYADKVWNCTIPLEGCFEYSVPPPGPLLSWMLRNPSKLTWPVKRDGSKRRYSEAAQRQREALIGGHGVTAAAAAQARGEKALSDAGAGGSRRQWWALEGFTEVDCCLESDSLVLFIEGKRNESPSASVSWLRDRNQLVRNLDCAMDYAAGRDFALLVMCKRPEPAPPGRAFEDGLPHRTAEQRAELRQRYLGWVSWQSAAAALGVDGLPHTRLDMPSPCVAGRSNSSDVSK